ncbi:MAG: DUF2182 domain-containing protein [Rhodocyclaceae bacterium]|nr:DUF2182 domain-containing protein [Rhodocyclaceae bacterium]MBX3669037.1 DUF2182 domain-containing protein [Rhodocyclaceae bacterium]
MAAPTARRVFVPVLGLLVAGAWLALWAWSLSPYARYLDHGDLTVAGPLVDICRSIPGGSFIVPAALSGAAWVLMCAAMMLPTTAPLFGLFDRLTLGRSDRVLLFALLALGYVSVWAAFGVAAHAAHAALLAGAGAVPAVAARGWPAGAAIIALAGAFQFSPLKYRCLEKCRTPLSFVMQYWRGRAEAAQAFRLGVHHGIFCVGCCWALMLLMFVVGSGNLGWMLALAAVMAVEKNLPWGRRMSAPLGFALLAWAALLVAVNLTGY